MRSNKKKTKLTFSSFRSFFQNYSLEGLEKHTDYLVTVAAKNLKGLGPEDSIELRTEDGGESKKKSARVTFSRQ